MGFGFLAQQARALANLKPGWDYEGAPPLDRDVVVEMVGTLLVELPADFWEPSLCAGADGSLAAEWHFGDGAAFVLSLDSETHWSAWMRNAEGRVREVHAESAALGMLREFIVAKPSPTRSTG